MLGLPDHIRACLFDLDGVLTDTASVHRQAWKAMFDDYLRARSDDTGEEFVPFDAGADYEEYVDGKPRLDGVRSFLESRGITLDDSSVEELGQRKNDSFTDVLHRDGVEVFEGSRRYLQAAADAGLRRAVVSSSANTREVLELTGLDPTAFGHSFSSEPAPHLPLAHSAVRTPLNAPEVASPQVHHPAPD